MNRDEYDDWTRWLVIFGCIALGSVALTFLVIAWRLAMGDL